MTKLTTWLMCNQMQATQTLLFQIAMFIKTKVYNQIIVILITIQT